MITEIRQVPSSYRPLAACILIAALFSGACASNREPVLTKLDPQTMVTINYLKSPFIFFRNLAASHIDTREYVYVGPLEANRSGDYRLYLWLATWSTMDDDRREQSPERLESIDIVADGKKLTLKMNGASAGAVGASESVYRRPVGWATEVYYDITIEQLRTIAKATDLKVQLSSTNETYAPWDDQVASKTGLLEFLRRAEF